MNKISFKEMYDAVSRKIKTAYPQKKIYSSSIHQNLDDGNFNLIPVSATITSQIGNRVQIKVTFDCLYYCESYEEMLDIAHDLPLTLSKVKTTSGDVIHGLLNDPTTEFADDVLHCIVSYECFGLASEVLPEGAESDTDLMYYLKQKYLGVKY